MDLQKKPTGYKIWKRYKKLGELVLVEQKRTPHRYANCLSIEVEALILGHKRKYPNWGAPKIREKIIRKYPDVKPPAKCTIHAVLDRNRLVNHVCEFYKSVLYLQYIYAM